jgi:MFS transporter, putative metabolite transport protein
VPSIKNTADDSDQAAAAFKRRFMCRLVLVLTGGMFLDGYILGIVGPVTGTMSDDLGLSDLWEWLIAAGALFGILVGSPLGAGPPTSSAASRCSWPTWLCS